jgi:hypothetical protein
MNWDSRGVLNANLVNPFAPRELRSSVATFSKLIKNRLYWREKGWFGGDLGLDFH